MWDEETEACTEVLETEERLALWSNLNSLIESGAFGVKPPPEEEEDEEGNPMRERGEDEEADGSPMRERGEDEKSKTIDMKKNGSDSYEPAREGG